MSEVRPKDGWKLKRDSFTKLLVYYADGNPRIYYSRDWKSPYSPARDRQRGLNALLGLIGKHAPYSETALIYDMDTGLELFRFYRGEPRKTKADNQ